MKNAQMRAVLAESKICDTHDQELLWHERNRKVLQGLSISLKMEKEKEGKCVTIMTLLMHTNHLGQLTSVESGDAYFLLLKLTLPCLAW